MILDWLNSPVRQWELLLFAAALAKIVPALARACVAAALTLQLQQMKGERERTRQEIALARLAKVQQAPANE